MKGETGKSRISTRKSHEADKAHPQGNQSFLLESSTPASSFHFHSLSLHSRLEAPELQHDAPSDALRLEYELRRRSTSALKASRSAFAALNCLLSFIKVSSERTSASVAWLKGRLGWPGSLETRNETWVPSGSHSAQDQTNNRPIISHHQRREAWFGIYGTHFNFRIGLHIGNFQANILWYSFIFYYIYIIYLNIILNI